MLLLILLGLAIECKAQTLEPCAPSYVLNRDIASIKQVFHMDGSFYNRFRMETSSLIFKLSGKSIPATKEGMDEILANSILIDAETFVNPTDYENAGRSGEYVVYKNLLGRPSKYWLAYRMPNGDLEPFMKADCMNLERKKSSLKQSVPYHAPAPTPTVDKNCCNGRHDTIVVIIKGEVDLDKNQGIQHPVYDLMNPGAYSSGMSGTVWETPHYGRINRRVCGERPAFNQVQNVKYNSVNPGTGNPGASPTHGDGPGASPTHGNGNPGASPTHGGGPGGSSTNGSGGPGGSNTHRGK